MSSTAIKPCPFCGQVPEDIEPVRCLRCGFSVTRERWQTRRNRASKPERYSEAFEAAWRDYPEREGGDSKPAAYRWWRAALSNGATEGKLHDAVRSYSAYCKAKRMVGGPFVYQAATFFGPSQHWRRPWKTPASARDLQNQHYSEGATNGILGDVDSAG